MADASRARVDLHMGVQAQRDSLQCISKVGVKLVWMRSAT